MEHYWDEPCGRPGRPWRRRPDPSLRAPIVFELRLTLPFGPERDRQAERLWEELGASWVGSNEDGLVAGFAEEAPARTAAAELPGAQLIVVDEQDLSYLDSWREWARPAVAGRLVVRPPWLPATSTPACAPGPAAEAVVDQVAIVIDPGHAFGHGGHPSTRLVLEAVSSRLRPGDSVLDVGCGSGVLSVAAAALGALSVTAIDIDPVALSVTAANAEANGVAERISVSGTPVARLPGAYDVVLANIGVAVLRTLAPELLARVAGGGWLVLSGLLDHQWQEVADVVKGQVEEVLHEDGWATLVIRSPGSSS